jgi:cytochrome c peroxidase
MRWHVAIAVGLAFGVVVVSVAYGGARDRSLDTQLARRMHELGYTGRIESTLTTRLGRRVDRRLANTGRLLWFDTVTGLNGDNACAGCHSPANAFGDTQPISIGVNNSGVVGPHRSGFRNMRRAPSVINTAFYPNLMWNSRFSALSGDPFDNSAGFSFPPPEGMSLSGEPHLLAAQAFIPPTERVELAGAQFSGNGDAMRAEVLRRLDAVPEYRRLFGEVFPAVRKGGPITFDMFGRAIAEFEFSLTFANAPVDRYARGDRDALTDQEKRGALLFFGAAGCVSCHSVSGASNEMFSDFRDHVLAVPQIAPSDSISKFDGPGSNEDFGREQVTGMAADRYAFRSSPLRNAALQPAFMHNGAFPTLRAAILHHLDVVASASSYDPAAAGLPADLHAVGPVAPMLARVDPLVSTPRRLSSQQLGELVAFVRDGLLDPRARPSNLRKLVPKELPSHRPTLVYEFPR